MSREPFRGFPTRSSLTPVPDLFFSRLLPEIDSLPELKVVLHAFWRLYRKQGALKFITHEELTSDKTLMEGLDGTGSPDEVLRGALDSAVSHGILLHVVPEGEGGARDAYFINSEANRAAVAKIQSGELSAHVMPQPQSPTGEEPANIFALYEHYIGLLTPMIAEELKEAEKLYPASLIEEAFEEAVSLNKRNWRYIARILERKRRPLEGKRSGASGRDFKKERGPGRYLRGRYGHLVRH